MAPSILPQGEAIASPLIPQASLTSIREPSMMHCQKTGKDVKEVTRQRKEDEEKRKQQAKEIYDNFLSGKINDLSLQQINDYINNVTPNNPYGRRLSQRLPQRVERAMHAGARENAIDALFSRISESAVGENERTRPSGRRAVEEKKKELLTA